LKGCKYVDEIAPYLTEQDLEDVLCSFKIDVRIVGDEYAKKRVLNFSTTKESIVFRVVV
jgi:glycerol-3-phosphate cytidylyltransferase